MKNEKLRLRLGVLLLTAALLIFTAIYKLNKTGNETGSKNESTKYDFAMGTSISVTVYDDKSADECAQEIVDDIKNLDSQVISWRDEGSELAEINKADAGELLEVSDVLFKAVAQSYKICEDSNGALDITLRPLLDCWNIEEATEENFSVPEEEDIKKSLAETGYEKMIVYSESAENSSEEDNNAEDVVEGNSKETEIDEVTESDETAAGGKIRKNEDITIDLGATGKGYTLDVVRDYINGNDISGAIVTVGGSVMVYGEKNSGESWKVGIRDPKGSAEDMVGYLEFSDVDYMCVSTSGDYEKYVEYEGKRYHHILDRSTGYPADSGLSSVTVMCKSGLDSDGLSTACFVLGEEKSKELLEKYDAEALFIDQDGNITMTEGMQKYFKEK